MIAPLLERTFVAEVFWLEAKRGSGRSVVGMLLAGGVEMVRGGVLLGRMLVSRIGSKLASVLSFNIRIYP